MKKRMGIGLLLVLVLISAATGCTAVWDTGATEDKKQSGAPPAEEPVVLHVYLSLIHISIYRGGISGRYPMRFFAASGSSSMSWPSMMTWPSVAPR